MPLPNFSVTGNLFEIIPGFTGAELATRSLTSVQLQFAPNVRPADFVVWEGDLYRVRPVIVTVSSDGSISNVDDPVLLLANDDGLNITGLQWQVSITTLGAAQTSVEWWFDAPADGATVDLATVAHAPATAIHATAGLTESQLLSLIADAGSDVRDALDGIYAGLQLSQDFTAASNGTVPAADTGQAWTAAGATWSIASGRALIATTANSAQAGYLSTQPSSGHDVTFFEADFDMPSGGSTFNGAVALIVSTQDLGTAVGAGALSAPLHVSINQAAYFPVIYNNVSSGVAFTKGPTTVGYPTIAAGTRVHVEGVVDRVNGCVYFQGPDGVVTKFSDPVVTSLGTYPWFTIEVAYGNASTDRRAQFQAVGADCTKLTRNAQRAKDLISRYQANRTTLTIVGRDIARNYNGQFSGAVPVDRALTFSKIQYEFLTADTGGSGCTVCLADLSVGLTAITGTSVTVAAGALTGSATPTTPIYIPRGARLVIATSSFSAGTPGQGLNAFLAQ